MDNNPKNISNDYNKSGFQVSLESIVSLISVLSVTIVVGFLLLLSFFNGDAKGFILVIGLAIWYIGKSGSKYSNSYGTSKTNRNEK